MNTTAQVKAAQIERQSAGTQYVYAVVNGVVEMIKK